MWKMGVMVQFKVLFHHFPGVTEENDSKIQFIPWVKLIGKINVIE
jgi:hypothetical protein